MTPPGSSRFALTMPSKVIETYWTMGVAAVPDFDGQVSHREPHPAR